MRQISKYLFVLLILVCPGFSKAQLAINVLDGFVHLKEGITCNYKVVFTTTGNDIKGYTVTTMEDGTELKANLKGTINKRKHTLEFKESPLPNVDMTGPCLFDVQLNYQVINGAYQFSGNFKGHDLDNKYCDEGSVEFEMKPSTYNPLDNTPKRKTSTPTVQPVTDTPALISRGVLDLPIKVTATDQRKIEWVSDSCVLEIWDGMVIDGDIVSIMVNNQTVLENYMLEAGKKRITFPLKNKTNTITITAQNEGSAPPNTSKVMLTDGRFKYSVLVSLKEGQSGVITLTKGSSSNR